MSACPADTEIPELCVPYGETIASCFRGYDPDEVALYCACTLSYYAPMYGANCAAAFEEFYACVTPLSCEELMMGPCADEMDNLSTECVI
jgi:hypothetical protein